MSKVSFKRLGDLINFKRGYDLPENKRIKGIYPVISSSGISGYHNNYKVDGKGVVTGRYGTLGLMYYVEGKYWPHNTALYVQNFKGNDPKYIYYLLSCLGRIKTSDKSTVPGVNRNELHEMIVPVIEDRNTQHLIANFLSIIDKKIEINNQMNAELHAMAKLIYEYWFVQFDFPDTEGKPYQSSGGKMVYNVELKREIPEGWSVQEIGDLVKFDRGISYKSKEIVDDGVPMINLNSFDLTGKYKEKGLKYFAGSYNEKKVVSQGDLVIAVTDVTRNADIIGKAFTIPSLFNKDILISCDVAKVVPSRLIDVHFLEMLFNSDDYHNYIKHFASGTLVLHLNLDGVKWCKIPLPPKSLLDKYSEIRKGINSKITTVIKENLELEKLRDWLLPMLMNGQVIFK